MITRIFGSMIFSLSLLILSFFTALEPFITLFVSLAMKAQTAGSVTPLMISHKERPNSARKPSG